MAIEPVLFSERGREKDREREREAVAVGYRPASWTMEKYRSQHPPDYHYAANDTTNTTTSTTTTINIRETLASLSTTHRRFSLWARISQRCTWERSAGLILTVDCKLELQAAFSNGRSDKNSPTVLKGHRYGFTSALDFQPILRYASAARASAPFFDLSTQEFVAIETGTFANDARS